MSQITEIAWAPLKAGLTEDSESAKSLKEMGPAMLARPGLEHAYFGRPADLPNSLEIINVWASEADYKASTSGPEHEKARALFGQLIDNSKHHAYHNFIAFDKPFSTVASAPVVEMTAIFLPTDVDKAAFEAEIANLFKAISGDGGYQGHVQGWAVEEVKGHPKMPVAKLFLAAVGRESIEKARASHENSKAHVAGLMKFSDVFEVHHTSFQAAK